MTRKDAEKKHEESFDEAELEAIEHMSAISAPAIFETIRRKGETELRRPASALILSGLVAGLALGFSVLAEALLRRHLPDAPWRPLIESAGYSVGFLLVILGHMQLFTENTITAVCPVLDEPGRAILLRLLRLWSLVLVFNLLGAIVFGLILYETSALDPDLWQAIVAISTEATGLGWRETLLRGVGAGWLIAALVWVMPKAEGSKPFLIVIVTYLVALAGFSHVVAGTTEAFALVFAGAKAWHAALFGFTLPALLGNVLGGTVFFTVLTWAQIRSELAEPEVWRRR